MENPSPQSQSVPESAPFTGYQKFVIAVLAFLQFTIILDFMIISPLGAVMMPALSILPSQFGLVVSAYAFSAGVSGILAAGFADKFDRKKLLLFFYFGFVVGTLLCGLANTFEFLLIARIITGLFGGVIGSVVLAITTDLFSFSHRGRVMGFLQSAFAGSQILGLPAGLFLSNHFGWHAPFFMIVGVSTLAGLLIAVYLKPITGHLSLNRDVSPLHHLVQTVTTRRYLIAFSATALLSIGGFLLMPFSSAYMVHNLKVDLEHLPLIYLITGLCSIFMGPLVGKISDRIGKMKTFTAGTLFSIIMVLIYTNLGVTPLAGLIVVNCLMFIGIFSRMIPSQALISAVPEPSSRGSFMSVSSSMQQIAGGIASIFAGLIVVQNSDGSLGHFNYLGYVMTVIALIALMQVARVDRMVREKIPSSSA